MMIQRIAADDQRGATDEDWQTATTLFDTLTASELIDPNLTQTDLLYRLFHESGVRVIDTAPIEALCACSEDRLRATLAAFAPEARDEMAENGPITAACEFCGTDYHFDITKF